MSCLLLALLLAPVARGTDDELTDLDREVLAVLTETVEEGPLVFHHEPGAIAAAVLAEDVTANRAAFDELVTQLEMPFAGRVHLFLYHDQAQVEELTGVETFAFATGTRSLHQVRDFRGTHELAHLFAGQFPGAGEGFSDPFVVEGLATGLTDFESGAPLHAWCATYAKFARLPSLWELRTAFPEGAAPGVHPYHVAGSFVRYLIERFGIARVKAFYVDALEARHHLGTGFLELERAWLDMLREQVVAPEHEDVVRGRLGLARQTTLPAARWTELTAFSEPDLTGWSAEEPGVWSADQGRLVGRRDGPWSVLWRALPAPTRGLRVRFRLREGTALKLEATAPEGAGRSEVVLTHQGTFLDAGDGYRGCEADPIAHGFWNELSLRRDGDREHLLLNDLLLLSVDRAQVGGWTRIGLGAEDARVEVERIDVLAP